MTDSCKHVSRIKTSIQLGILSPDRWHCRTCLTTESVWACLSCTNFACGRYIAEHALKHFQTTGHPLCIDVNEKFVYCYLCDDFVLNDNAPGDIKLLRMALDAITAQDFDQLSKQRRGRRILRYHMRDTKRMSRRLLKADDIQTALMRNRVSCLSWALRLWWNRYLEKKQISDASAKIRAVSGKKRSPLLFSPAFTGLRNLGNTCYMNSVLQVLRHTAPFSNFILSHSPEEVLYRNLKRRSSSCKNQTAPLTESDVSVTKKSRLDAGTIVLHPSVILTEWTSSDTSSPTLHSSFSPPTISKYGQFSDEAVSGSKVPQKSEYNVCSVAGGLNGGHSVHELSNSHQAETLLSVIKSENNETDTVKSIPSVYEELHNVFRTLWSGQRTVFSPSSLLYTIWTALPSFKGYKQQDAQEFLSVFLDRIQTELNGDDVKTPICSRDFINRTFQGHLVSHIECTNCNMVACTEEPFSELSLALPPLCYSGELNHCDLVDLLHNFVSPTFIDGRSYACRECNRRQSQLQSPVSRAPEIISDTLSSPRCDRLQHSSSYDVDRIVTVALSRLPTPTKDSICSFTNMGPQLYCSPQRVPSSASSSLSESAFSASPSLISLDDESLLVSETARLSQYSTSVTTPVVESGVSSQPNKSPSPYLTSATQTIRLTRLPRVLRLHIKRFRWIGRQREKVGCHVSFPLVLDLTDCMLTDIDRVHCNRVHAHDVPNSSDFLVNYRRTHSAAGFQSTRYDGSSSQSLSNGCRRLYHLTGVIVHHGRGFQSGHYTAYCLNDQPECWIHCNDANVTLSNFDEVAASQAYLLFYSELMPSTPYRTNFNYLSRSLTLPSISLTDSEKFQSSTSSSQQCSPAKSVITCPTDFENQQLATTSTARNLSVSLGSSVSVLLQPISSIKPEDPYRDSGLRTSHELNCSSNPLNRSPSDNSGSKLTTKEATPIVSGRRRLSRANHH